MDHNINHGVWWPADAKTQDIIGHLLSEYFTLNVTRVDM